MPDGGRPIWQRLAENFRRRRAMQRATVAGTLVSGHPPNPLPPLSHGFVHEPYSGAWQQNIWCRAPSDPANFSAVFACVQIISTDVAKLTPIVYRRLEDGSKEPHPQHPAQRVLLHPNEFQTRVDFFQQLMASILLVGPSYTYLQRDARNVVSAMYPLSPYRTTPTIADDGSLFFEAGYGAASSLIPYETDWAHRSYIPARDIMYHRELTSPSNPLVAISPITAALTSAMMGSLIQSQQQAFYENMSRSSGILTAPHKISKETADRLRVDWEQNFRGGSIGRVAVLGEGLDWKPLSLSAVDSQLIDALKWTVGDVARAYRVPDYMLGIAAGGAHTSKSAEQLTRNYYAQTLSYHLEALEVRLADALDLAPDVFIEFDMAALLRADFDVRMLAYKNAINSGVYSINELRAMEELKPMEGGEQPLVQVQYVPLSTLAERHAAASAKPVSVPVQPTTPTTTPVPPPTPPKRQAPGEPDEDADLVAALGAGLGDMLSRHARKRIKEKL